MEKKTIFILIFCLVIIGILVFVYYKYEPLEKEYYNLSISAEYQDKKIITGFKIEPINIIGNTSKTYYETYKVEKSIIKIKNLNIENQNFYSDELEINLTENKRIDLILSKQEKIEHSIIENDTINLTIYSKNFKDIDFCLKGSFNYMFIKVKNFKEILLKDYNDYEICYDGNFSLIDNNKTIEISYEQFNNPEKNDYIDIIFIDKENNTKIIKLK